jgi:hypothetical protein
MHLPARLPSAALWFPARARARPFPRCLKRQSHGRFRRRYSGQVRWLRPAVTPAFRAWRRYPPGARSNPPNVIPTPVVDPEEALSLLGLGPRRIATSRQNPDNSRPEVTAWIRGIRPRRRREKAGRANRRVAPRVRLDPLLSIPGLLPKFGCDPEALIRGVGCNFPISTIPIPKSLTSLPASFWRTAPPRDPRRRFILRKCPPSSRTGPSLIAVAQRPLASRRPRRDYCCSSISPGRQVLLNHGSSGP